MVFKCPNLNFRHFCFVFIPPPICRHGILHKPSASWKFWPKSFRKSSGILDIFCITNYAWFLTFLTMWKIQIVLTLLWKISQVAFQIVKLSMFLHQNYHIINHLEYFFHISSIEPKDLQGLPQILPQSAKFLPRACSRRSRNIPSLPIWDIVPNFPAF